MLSRPAAAVVGAAVVACAIVGCLLTAPSRDHFERAGSDAAVEGGDAGTSTVLWEGPGSAWGLAIDDTRVYFTNPTEGRVDSVKKDGSDPSGIATGQASPTAIVVDDAVFWATVGDGGFGVWRGTKPIVTTPPVSRAEPSAPAGIALTTAGGMTSRLLVWTLPDTNTLRFTNAAFDIDAATLDAIAPAARAITFDGTLPDGGLLFYTLTDSRASAVRHSTGPPKTSQNCEMARFEGIAVAIAAVRATHAAWLTRDGNVFSAPNDGCVPLDAGGLHEGPHVEPIVKSLGIGSHAEDSSGIAFDPTSGNLLFAAGTEIRMVNPTSADGGATQSTTLVGALTGCAAGVAVDSTYVYFACSSGGRVTVRKAPLPR